MQFKPFTIYVENKFGYDIIDKKINDYKLDKNKRPIYQKK